MATSQTKQALRNRRRELGLCIHCGDPAREGQTRCEKCAKRDAENRQRYAERDAKRGVCCNIGCSNPVQHPKRYCQPCVDKSTARGARAWQKRIGAGLCGDCGEKPFWNGKARCEECHKKLLASVQRLSDKRAAAGLCRICGNHPIEAGYKQCQRCIEKRSRYHAALKLEVLAAYGGPVCVGCDETEVAVLQIDHTDGGGHRHAQEIGGRGKMYSWLKKNGFPTGFRVLCSNCNIRAARKLPFPNER